MLISAPDYTLNNGETLQKSLRILIPTEDMESITIIIIVGITLFFIGLFVYAFISERKRREGLEKVSLEMGFLYTPKAVFELPDLELFNKGSTKKKNLLTATQSGITWSIFDFQFSAGQSVQAQTVVMAQLDGELPEFTLSRKHFYHKVGKIVGFKEIVVDGYPEFSQKYYLKGKDESAIRKLFSSNVILTLMSQQLKEHVEAKNNFIIMYKPNIQINPEDIYKFFQKAVTIINLFRDSSFFD